MDRFNFNCKIYNILIKLEYYLELLHRCFFLNFALALFFFGGLVEICE